MSINLTALARDIHVLAEWLEHDGNQGHYTSYLPENLRWVMHPKFADYRKGILFYSSGWGWRVRKKPHWKTVYNERFGQWYEPQEVKEL